MGYMDEYKRWCEDSYFDESTKAELLSIKDDAKEIEERFYKNLFEIPPIFPIKL